MSAAKVLPDGLRLFRVDTGGATYWILADHGGRRRVARPPHRRARASGREGDDDMTTTDTTYYLISSRTTGSDLGVFAGRTEAEALDAMARDAGYKDFYYLASEIDADGRDGLEIEEITREEADRLREEWGVA